MCYHVSMRIPGPDLSPVSNLWPGSSWPMAMDCYAVGKWVRTLHSSPQDFDEGDLLERIERHAHYKLQSIALNRLDPHEWTVCESLAQEYATLDTPCPPIVIDPYDSIIDGTHRVNAALRRGEATILAYVAQPD